ncbi:MAG: sugar phosphate nucleotidyltransferase [Candidatus Falkowbacteria bacterium]
MKIVIRAGGTGTRLWPMSRQNNPKQFQPVVGEDTMIKVTYDRVRPAVDSADDLFVSINRSMSECLQSALPEVVEENIITEAESRNTGPAMCLEVCFLSVSCSPDDVIASLPSDDYISDAEAFRNLLKLSEKFLAEHNDYILTPAVRPAYLDTGYSYFKAGKNLDSDGEEAIFKVAKVIEKPNEERCQELIDSGVYYCHTGMYIWRLGYIKELFEKLQPEMTKICQEIVGLMQQGGQDKQIADLYASLEKMTIESAITDKAPNLAMSVSSGLGWSDLGKWHVIKRMLLEDETENLTKGRVIANKAKNNLVYTTNNKKVVVINDLDDLIVVDTPEGLFISSSLRSAEVKDCVTKIKEKGWEECL